MSKEKKPFTKDHVLSAVGANMALFAVLCALSPLTHVRYVTFPIHFLFGTIGFLLLCALLFESGIHLLFHKKWKAYPLRIYFGLPLALIGLWLLLSEAFRDASLAGNDFPAALTEAFAHNGASLYFAPKLAAGFLGQQLLGLIDGSVGVFLSYIVAALVLTIGLAVLFFPLLRLAFSTAKANAAVNSAKRLKEKEERERRKQNDYVIEPSDGQVPEPIAFPEPEPLPPSPELTFAKDEEEEAAEPPSFTKITEFTRAGGSTLPLRRNLRTQRVEHDLTTEISGDPTPVQSPTAPREIETPPFSSYASNPVRTSGLQEAVFCPAGKKETPPKPVAPAPISFHPAEPPAPAVPVKEPPAEEPIEEPSPVTRIPTNTDIEPIPEPAPEPEEEEDDVFLGEEEEEAPYVAPTNDPIVLAPDPTSIITPETLAPTPEPEPEPVVMDDDLEGPLPPYVFPPASLLAEGKNNQDMDAINAECAQKAELITQIFSEFHVGARVTEYLVGPSITRYSIAADPGVSVSVIGRYVPDLEVRLGGVPVRFVERVYGLACSALEVANDTRRIVPFKEVFTGLPERKDGADLHIPFGVDISGQLKEADLAKFPHMLVGGTSGSGKSIFAHGILMSLVMRNRPEDLKLVLIDPKRGVEMAPYRDLPHLLCPIIKEAKPARNALKKLCDVMDHRYEMFLEAGVRDIKGYNADYALPQGKKRMPYIVVFVDEFSDLVGECKDISEYVLRIAQKARACGIHLVVATQRPEVKVITGTIKSNLNCRVALTVASSVDSQTILGVGGAEDLYSYGDMLIDCQEISKRDLVRAQGCLVVGAEMKAVNDFIRKQMPPHYDPDFLDLEDHEEEPEIRDGGYAPAAPVASSQELKKMADEDKYQYVKSVIMTREFCSISMIQREFEVGFPRAGKILARLQSEGIVASPGDTPNNSRGCRVLVHEDPSGGEA